MLPSHLMLDYFITIICMQVNELIQETLVADP